MIDDEIHGIGPIEGIRRLLTASESEWLFLCAGDMPLMRRALPQYLSEFVSSDYDAYIGSMDGRLQPLCGLYSKAVLPAIREQIALKSYKITELLQHVRTKTVPLEFTRFDRRILENVNTPRDSAPGMSALHFRACERGSFGEDDLCRDSASAVESLSDQGGHSSRKGVWTQPDLPRTERRVCENGLTAFPVESRTDHSGLSPAISEEQSCRSDAFRSGVWDTWQVLLAVLSVSLCSFERGHRRDRHFVRGGLKTG